MEQVKRKVNWHFALTDSRSVRKGGACRTCAKSANDLNKPPVCGKGGK